MSERQALHVGIDLGTSRSSISASNGQRHVVESYVGWPLDMVARKVLKKSVLIGRECARKVAKAGDVGWQPPLGGPRLFPMPAVECHNCGGLGYRREASGEPIPCDLCGDEPKP